MTSRLSSLLIWALVAAAAVFWGLRLFARPQPVPAQAVVASLGAAAGGDLSRLLGTPPLQAAAPAAEVPADSRFRLLGVVAPRPGQGGAGNGLALVSVDGKPARAVAVGRDLEPGLRLLAVSQRQADFGASAGGAATVKLSLPPLLEAARGRPGDAAAGAMAPRAMPLPGQGARPGQMQQAMPGAPIGLPTGPGQQRPGAMVGPGVVLPGVQQAEPQQEAPADGANQPLR